MMSVMCKSLKLGIIAVMLHSVALNTYAESNDDAQQALQQLRLLQQKLSQHSDPNNQTAPSAQASPSSSVAKEGFLSSLVAGGQTAPNNTASAAAVNNPPTKKVPDVAMVSGSPPSENEREIIDHKAFDDMTRSIYPLNPEQIIRLKQVYQNNEYAKTSTAGTPPKPTASSQFVNLSPGSTPPVIRLSQGFVSSLVFLDSTGAPWPIAAYDLGDPSSFNIQWDRTSNTLMIQAMKLYNYGNLAVRLRGLNTPVMLTLIPGQKAVDYRMDLRIQGYGPNAKNLPMESGLPAAASDLLLHVLEGVPPVGSQRLVVSGGDARAWLSNQKMYVRTNLTVLSPGWIASMTSADGTHAYEMQKSPVLLVSWHGKVMQLKVEGL